MTIRLDDTNAGEVAAAIRRERHHKGATAAGMVMTLVIVADEEHQSDATLAAQYSAGEHPCRILVIIPRPGRGSPRLDATVSVGDDEGPGELVRMRLRGKLARHAESVVLPLLLSDTPVVAFWPSAHPADVAGDPIGHLAGRRIIDTASARRFTAALAVQKEYLASGDTDLAWTRLTPWRAALAAMLDQPYAPITGATIHSQPIPSAPLLRTWLEWRLGVPVAYLRSRGPAINQVVIHTEDGDITITRPEGHMATVERNGVAVKELYLPRRDLDDLLAEDLRRLDPDDVYEETMRRLDLDRLTPDTSRSRGRGRAAAPNARRTTRGGAVRARSQGAEDAAIMAQEGLSIPEEPKKATKRRSSRTRSTPTSPGKTNPSRSSRASKSTTTGTPTRKRSTGR